MIDSVQNQPLASALRNGAVPDQPQNSSRNAIQPKKIGATELFNGHPVITIESPRKGDTWIYNKSYPVKWIIAGFPERKVNIGGKVVSAPISWDSFEITLWDTSKKKITTIRSSNPAPIPTQGSIIWTVPFTSKIKVGDYFIRLKAVRTIDGKQKIYSADSGLFRIGWQALRTMKRKVQTAQSGMESFPRDRKLLSDTRPEDGTKFTITGIDYPQANGMLILHIHVEAPEPFSFDGRRNAQNIFVYFSIFAVASKSAKSINIQLKPAGSESIRAMNNPSLFPKGEIPKGPSDYIIRFKPKLSKKLVELILSYENGKCKTYFPPEIEIHILSFSKSGKSFNSPKAHAYLSEIKHDIKNLNEFKNGFFVHTTGIGINKIKSPIKCDDESEDQVVVYN